MHIESLAVGKGILISAGLSGLLMSGGIKSCANNSRTDNYLNENYSLIRYDINADGKIDYIFKSEKEGKEFKFLDNGEMSYTLILDN